MNSILILIEKAKSLDKYSMEILLTKFDPILSSLSNKLRYDCAESDLTIFFIELIYSIKLCKIINLSEGALVNYISKASRRKRKNYQDIIVRVTYKFDIVDAVKKDVEYIKQYVIKKPK